MYDQEGMYDKKPSKEEVLDILNKVLYEDKESSFFKIFAAIHADVFVEAKENKKVIWSFPDPFNLDGNEYTIEELKNESQLIHWLLRDSHFIPGGVVRSSMRLRPSVWPLLMYFLGFLHVLSDKEYRYDAEALEILKQFLFRECLKITDEVNEFNWSLNINQTINSDSRKK